MITQALHWTYHRQNLKWGILRDCLQSKFWSLRNVKSQNAAMENTSSSIVDLKCKKEDHLAPIICGLGSFIMTSILASLTLFKINISKMFCSTWKKCSRLYGKGLGTVFEYQTPDNKCGELVFTHMQLSLVGWTRPLSLPLLLLWCSKTGSWLRDSV